MEDSAEAQTESGPSIPDAIRLKREALGLSKRELGRRTGLSVAYVSSLEAGDLNPGFRAFSRLAAELRLTPTEIYVLVAAEAKR